MKRKTITSILFFAIILNTLAFSISASGDAVGWYVKRNGMLRPQISKEQEIIEKYNGYYIDKKLTDTSENKVIYRHAFRNTMIPLATLLAGILPSLFGGMMITEQVFGIDGICLVF